MTSPALVPAAEAAARLGVKRATLYAYVSRGLLRALALPGRRGSWFDPVDLDAVSARARAPQQRRPDLRIASAVTLVDHGRYYYRGRDPVRLAASASFEGVAEFLWTGRDVDRPPAWPVNAAALEPARRAVAELPASASATDRFRVIVAVLGTLDPLRVDLRQAGALATARRLVATAVAALTPRASGGIAAQVVAWLAVPRHRRSAAVAAIDDVLVLMADHELAASTLAVRVVASFGADPYAAVAAGLGALSGNRHGAASRRLEQALAAMSKGLATADAIRPLLMDAQAIPGFGHSLYPDGDPRVGPVLTAAAAVGDTSRADRLLTAMRQQGVPPANVDLALAAFTHALGARPGAGEGIFAVARLAGWLAHAMEEYEARSDFRMRAVYIGPRPDPA